MMRNSKNIKFLNREFPVGARGIRQYFEHISELSTEPFLGSRLFPESFAPVIVLECTHSNAVLEEVGIVRYQ
ncbi:hypothetical protein GCM10007380_38660 [Gottfriedia solisilvae]|uniref:Uncharacterized protein n=1 Tax=Gottfriedia solisilvae TaxID=1516104 RepID=A0A8J3F2C4_9BACI|nr:hypothetical protein GCM10007380_38660 [Gottfriedia solisilvae]